MRDRRDAEQVPDAERTAIVLKNVPAECVRDTLLHIINEHGFQGLYDFLYLPMDFTTARSRGYATINFISSADAQRACSKLNGIHVHGGELVTEMSNVHAGINSLLQRYQNGELMNDPNTPEDYKPLFLQGQCTPPANPAS